MGTAESVSEKVEVAEWMNRVKRARLIAMQSQKLAFEETQLDSEAAEGGRGRRTLVDVSERRNRTVEKACISAARTVQAGELAGREEEDSACGR